jgi:hypothetical protein
VENLDNLHAAKMEQPFGGGARFLYDYRRLIVRFRPFEVRELVIALKMSDSRRHLVYQIVIVGH